MITSNQAGMAMTLTEFRKLEKAATAGEWQLGYYALNDPTQPGYQNYWAAKGPDVLGLEAAAKDAAFIAACRQMVPKLLAAVKARAETAERQLAEARAHTARLLAAAEGVLPYKPNEQRPEGIRAWQELKAAIKEGPCDHFDGRHGHRVCSLCQEEVDQPPPKCATCGDAPLAPDWYCPACKRFGPSERLASAGLERGEGT